MITQIKSPHLNTLIYELDYFITATEIDIINKGIEESLKNFDKINLILDVQVKGESFSALVKEFKLGLKYWNNINKIAYICDSSILKSLIVIDDLFTKFKEKCFSTDETAKAWKWINE